MIYFVRGVRGGPVKIGTSLQLATRLVSLGYEADPENGPLRVLGVTSGNRPEEKALHRRFTHLRLKGEWFRAEPELLDFVDRNTIQWDGTEEMPATRTLFTIKGMPVWHEWLKAYSARLGIPLMAVIDRALKEQAQAEGFPEPMPSREP